MIGNASSNKASRKRKSIDAPSQPDRWRECYPSIPMSESTSRQSAREALCGVRLRRRRLVQIESERIGLIGQRAAPDRLDRSDHAALAVEELIGERDDAPIGGRRR